MSTVDQNNILIFLICTLLGYIVAKFLSGNGFNVGGNYSCVRSAPIASTCLEKDCKPGPMQKSTGMQVCNGCKGWQINKYHPINPKKPFLSGLKYECQKDSNGPFENISKCNEWKNENTKTYMNSFQNRPFYDLAPECPKPSSPPPPPPPPTYCGMSCTSNDDCPAGCSTCNSDNICKNTDSVPCTGYGCPDGYNQNPKGMCPGGPQTCNPLDCCIKKAPPPSPPPPPPTYCGMSCTSNDDCPAGCSTCNSDNICKNTDSVPCTGYGCPDGYNQNPKGMCPGGPQTCNPLDCCIKKSTTKTTSNT